MVSSASMRMLNLHLGLRLVLNYSACAHHMTPITRSTQLAAYVPFKIKDKQDEWSEPEHFDLHCIFVFLETALFFLLVRLCWLC